MKKRTTGIIALLIAASLLSGCALIKNEVNELNGAITGNTYHASFYTDEGEKFMEMSGSKINLESNSYTKTFSSMVTVLIDGKEVESCGSTMIFAEDGLTPEVDFTAPDAINSTTDGSLSDNTFVAGIVNHYKNYFGKSRVVVIQSQLGDPICAYSGDEVYWTVCEDLPKTTKLMIDGETLYILRANFQIFDKELLD